MPLWTEIGLSGQIVGKPTKHCADHIFYLNFVKINQKVCRDDFKIKFEWVSLGQKLDCQIK